MRRPAQRAFLLPMNLDTIPNAELEAIEFPTLTAWAGRRFPAFPPGTA